MWNLITIAMSSVIKEVADLVQLTNNNKTASLDMSYIQDAENSSG